LPWWSAHQGRPQKTMVCPTSFLGALASLVLLLPLPAAAQALYGSLVGNLSDSSGGALAGARIRIVSATTNDAREPVSNTSGGYNFTNLDAGSYTVTVSAPEFQSYQNTNATVSLDAIVRLDVTLQVRSDHE